MKAFRHVALLFCIAFATAADEGTRLRADLVGTQEVPALFRPGSASFEARVLDNDTRIVFELTYEQLSAPPLVAHVHFGQRSVNGGVSFFLCGGGGKPPCPASTSGTVTGTVVAADVGGPALVKRMSLRGRKALEGMVKTAPDVESPPDKFAIEMMFAAIGGATRHVLESGVSPMMIRNLRRHLVVLCQSYMTVHLANRL